MEEIHRYIREILLNQNRAIEDACYRAWIENCGVRIERGRFDANKFSVKADKDVPVGEIHEHLIDEVDNGKDLDF